MAPSIMWFRRDLRLEDHPALRQAVELGGSDGVIPLFVFDQDLLAPAGPARVAFLESCLRALTGSMGAELVVRAGDPAAVVSELADEVGAIHVCVTGDAAPAGLRRDLAVERALQAQGRQLHRASTPYAVAPGTVVSEKGAPLKVFTAFRRRWEKIGPHGVLPAPPVRWRSAESSVSLDALARASGSKRPELFEELPDVLPAMMPPGGEAAALDRLAAFVDEGLDAYAEQRDQLGAAGTSRLSPSLHVGCIHPRTVLAACAGPGAGRETFRSEIAWREFYADVLFHAPESVSQPLQPQLAGLEWDRGPAAQERFRLWARGQTGIPVVDAGMRQLLEEGWMHNRARMITASFLIKHLHLDWRRGARWFMWRLIDADVASNQHGWQWTAGTGTDAAPFHRIFNPVLQAERFDADAIYVHRWIPELRGIDPPGVLGPGGGVDLLHPADYPAPIVDLKAERAEALRRYAVVRDRHRARAR